MPTLVTGMSVLSLAPAADAGVSPTTIVAGTGNLLPAAGVGDLPPAAGADDILPAVGVGIFSIIAGAGPFLPTANAEASTLAHCWTGGGLPATSVSKSSDFEKSTPPDEKLGSGVDSGVVSGERPSLSHLLFSFSCSSLLHLFLSWVAFSSSFLFFSSYARRRFAAWVSGSGGSETYPVRVSPCEHNKD